MVYMSQEKKNNLEIIRKQQQERIIIDKIMKVLNQNNNNLEEFIKNNENYKIFLERHKMENVVKHFGETLNENDYKIILANLKNYISKTPQKIEKNNELNLNYLHEINRAILNEEGNKIFMMAVDYQLNNNNMIKLDINNKIMVDENGNTFDILKENDKYIIKDKKVNENLNFEIKNNKTKILKQNPNSIYYNV